MESASEEPSWSGGSFREVFAVLFLRILVTLLPTISITLNRDRPRNNPKYPPANENFVWTLFLFYKKMNGFIETCISGKVIPGVEVLVGENFGNWRKLSGEEESLNVLFWQLIMHFTFTWKWAETSACVKAFSLSNICNPRSHFTQGVLQ